RQRAAGRSLGVHYARGHGRPMRPDDLGGRLVDVPRDSGNAAVADRDIAALARGSRAVEEKTATDQNVMTRAQPVTGPLSSVLGCEPITLCRPCSSSCASRAFTPAFAG